MPYGTLRVPLSMPTFFPAGLRTGATAASLTITRAFSPTPEPVVAPAAASGFGALLPAPVTALTTAALTRGFIPPAVAAFTAGALFATLVAGLEVVAAATSISWPPVLGRAAAVTTFTAATLATFAAPAVTALAAPPLNTFAAPAITTLTAPTLAGLTVEARTVVVTPRPALAEAAFLPVLAGPLVALAPGPVAARLTAGVARTAEWATLASAASATRLARAGSLPAAASRATAAETAPAGTALIVPSIMSTEFSHAGAPLSAAGNSW
ncbi:hypothetical protein D477_016930 [Arthrobacter crystallopoietes BAB-32]|uniref:Uncharacterized protein n=2 Tax=Crystallibacter crystallopoietes TaxID=37928 RepID=N1UZ46_9MICC|nr:hypothetical protein D477_016930 [Arthrobacter crystallopoietes BAB-32]